MRADFFFPKRGKPKIGKSTLWLKSNVSKLVLGGGVVDISVLCQYTGKGKCKYVKCMCDSYDKYKSQVTQWAHNIGWKVKDCGGVLEVFKA